MENITVKGLLALGFDTGWVVNGNEIILWERSEPKPTEKEIVEAAKNYVEAQPTIEDKLAFVGLSLTDLKSALGL